MDRITQSEIQAFVNAKDALDETEGGILRRMADGAEVEPGELVACSNFGPDTTIEMSTLEIETAEEAAEFAALRAQGKAERAAAPAAA